MTYNPLNGNPKSQFCKIIKSGSRRPSKIEHLVGAVDWLSALKPLVMKVKVGGRDNTGAQAIFSTNPTDPFILSKKKDKETLEQVGFGSCRCQMDCFMS